VIWFLSNSLHAFSIPSPRQHRNHTTSPWEILYTLHCIYTDSGFTWSCESPAYHCVHSHINLLETATFTNKRDWYFVFLLNFLHVFYMFFFIAIYATCCARTHFNNLIINCWVPIDSQLHFKRPLFRKTKRTILKEVYFL
jgi:hypothetical protein